MNVSLHTSAITATAHEAVFLPWLERVARTAAQMRQPVAVLVPLRPDAYALKARALAAGIGLFGVHFLTPGDLRDRLAAHLGLRLRTPLREHLRLLLATVAERVAARRGDEVTAGVAAAPDQLLKAIDLIGGGGWTFAEAGPPRLRPVVAEFETLLKSAGFTMVHDADRALRVAALSAHPLFRELFVANFNALHWPLWPLLEAAVHLAQTATVCLTEPRDETHDLDAAWIGTWEETFGATETIPADAPYPPAAVLRLPETAQERAQRAAAPAREIAFLVGQDTAEQARAIAARGLQFLADPACERLGVLFPAAGALSRRVAALLAELDVPHHDGIAHHAPGPFEDPAWPAWLALQGSPCLPSLLAYLRASDTARFAGLSAQDAARELEGIFNELLLDDLGVLAEYYAHHSHRRHAPALADALHALPLLPERATLNDFLACTDDIFRELGWETRAAEMRRIAADWRDAGNLSISRRAWLRWLGETLVSWRVTRAVAGSQPYSRLHLLPYAQAESQSWTHLIAAGLNEGLWPPALEDAGILGEEEIDALNHRLRRLNVRATAQGRQGEGHVTVQPGRAFCLGPTQRRALAARQFFSTIESATIAVAVSAQLHDETAPEHPLNPSEFFAQLYVSARGRAVPQETMTALRDETACWLDASGLFAATPRDSVIGSQTRLAYDARRNAAEPFGEYEFALRTAPQPPLRLAATAWDRALSSPAETFLAEVLGVAASGTNDQTPWALAQGIWTHAWLRALSGTAGPRTFAPLPLPPELHARVLGAARGFRDRVRTTLAARKRSLPDWWTSAWEQALLAATRLTEGVAAVAGRTHVAAEWTIDDTTLPIEGGALHVRGRIDLLLAAADSLDDIWLVDYKTGNRQALRTKDLAAGKGVQLALYALALRAAGAREVGLSLLTPGAALDAPQVRLADVEALTGLWRGLLRMQESGTFGMRGALRAEFGHGADYPLATLAIDEDLLEEKWARTHPDFADEEEEP